MIHDKIYFVKLFLKFFEKIYCEEFNNLEWVGLKNIKSYNFLSFEFLNFVQKVSRETLKNVNSYNFDIFDFVLALSADEC